tara:strand:+ start:977 stop:1126 length:150 start_codon:yes stop_codon:yes gene_type:complete
MPDNKSMMQRLEALGPVRPNPSGEESVRRLVAEQPDADVLLGMILGGAA